MTAFVISGRNNLGHANVKKNLVIDDENHILETIKIILAAKNYFIVTATHGHEGTAATNSQHFDLIITDMLMPEKECLKTMMELKREQPTILNIDDQFRRQQYQPTRRLAATGKKTKGHIYRRKIVHCSATA